MTQEISRFLAEGDSIDHTPSANVTGGDVVTIGGIPCLATEAIVNARLGAARCTGIVELPKDNAAFVLGDQVNWDADAVPLSNANAAGAASYGGIPAGVCVQNANAAAEVVRVLLSPFQKLPVKTAAATGTTIANSTLIGQGFYYITAADDTAAIRLPPAAQGAMVIVKNAVANKILKVFPTVGDNINAGAANAVYNQTNGAVRTYVAINAAQWYTDPETIV